MPFFPNTTCVLHRRSARTDVHGRYTYTTVPSPIPCAVIGINLSTDKSSVRADSSGSRGRAEIQAGTAKFLFPTMTQITSGDVVDKDGFSLRVTTIQPRHAVDGRIDHLEVDFERAEPV